MAQERFWKEFHQLKVHIIFLQELLLRAERNERLAKMGIAITSSVSIGAWAIWKEYAAVWGGIIAASQVFSAIHPHLPYKERLKTYSSVLRDLEKLFIDAEHMWQSVADGSMSIQQINKERTQLLKKKNEVLVKHMPNGIFPSEPKIAERAEAEAIKYFAYYYPAEEDPTELSVLLKEQAPTGSSANE